MEKLVVRCNKKPLIGSITISGSKNAALPEMAAALLTAEPVHLLNIPKLKDIESMSRLLQEHGAIVEHDLSEKNILKKMTIVASDITNLTAHYDLVRKMRASVLVLGPLLARFGEATVSLPGGCAIGSRPINLHLEALEAMGAKIKLEGGYVIASAPNGLSGANIVFDTISVGATENTMMAATLAVGKTTIKNAAKEPEIIDLACLLNAMGADVQGAGTDTIIIEGKATLHGATHKIIADRIEAGSLAVAAAITNGELFLEDANPEDMPAIIYALEKTGVSISAENNGMRVTSNGRAKPIDIHTAPFPGFATDMQAQFMSLLMIANGTSHIKETLFENRFMHVPELNRLSGNINISDGIAIINGVDKLKGAEVMATDLRASFSLILAGLVAEGETIVNRVYHLDRGYENLEWKLNACGADIKRFA